MHLKTTALLNLALYFATLCPTQASESNINIVMPDQPKSNLSEENSFFLMFPPEMLENIASSEPGVYGRLLEAFPEWKGFHHLDLKCLLQSLKEEYYAKTLDEDASVYALRLLSPAPVDPKKLDIMKFPPSSVFKLFNFLIKHYRPDVSKLSFILLPFVSSLQFNEWYRLCTDNEREWFGNNIFRALLIVGKIDTAFSEPDLLKYSNTLRPGPAFWAFLQDDINRFDEVKFTLSKYVTLNVVDFIGTAIAAKARNILRNIFVRDLKEIENNEIEKFLETAFLTEDVDIFSIVLNKFSTQNIDLIKLLHHLISFSMENLDILRVILQKIEYQSLDDDQRQNLLNVMKSGVFSENVASFKLLYDWIHSHDSARMDQIAVELIPIAIRKESDFFIKHLLEKDGTGKYKNSLIKLDPILDCFKDISRNPRDSPYPRVIKYLLTKVDSGAGPEFPIIGSDQFMANELLSLLIELENVPSCEVALAKNTLGELVFPFIEINDETVKLALEKCPQCLLYFPPEIVNEYIKLNPGFYKQSFKLYAILTSATNGKPTFSAMKRYLTPEYLTELLTDYENDSEKRYELYLLFAAIPDQYNASPRIQSAFTLNTFTPEQYSILMNFWDKQYCFDSGNLMYALILKIFLSKGEDGAPYCPYFSFSRNVLREPEYLCSPIAGSLLQSYQGQLLYGLSIKYLNEMGEETHLLAELPKIVGNNQQIITILEVLLKTDKNGNFILKDVSLELVQNIAKNCAEEEKWYSELLLRELENSLPPWAFF